MPHIPLEAVEFVGGPFDGLLQFVSSSDRVLTHYIAAPVNPHVVQTIDGCPTMVDAATTSIAIYELRTDMRGPYYAFLGSVAPERFEVAD